ncbi:hypothetical protein PHMEG_00030976 [Phytophthora megakarya]|uniref:Uncharacterized protein n=1 Tax=Phytophthora megakarya TaxID=4795 RepID=A0A225V1F9_9STRA|nr:hypothetical protein PHMEG_00030976 [Phytophthora megakarya]
MLDGVCVFHRYDEDQQTVLVGTTVWYFPTGGLQFEGHYWTVISPSLADSSHSVVQSCYRLQEKVEDATSMCRSDLESARALVMSKVGKKMHCTMQLLQNTLLSNVELGPYLLEV